MASGASGGNNSGSKLYDFDSDDILCSYEDHGNQDTLNGNHSDPAIGTHSPTYFQKSRMGRSSGGHPASSAFSPPVESPNEDVIPTVEKIMKKYTDNLMRFLEGISSRLSQLELYCYNLDKSIGEMRSDLARDHGEADSKLKSVEKHIQEVHRSMQILRDKQELAETHKELAKLQFTQKESTTSSSSDERATPQAASDPKKSDNTPDVHSQQLALALPARPPLEQQQQPQLPVAPPQNVAQPQASYYVPSPQIPNNSQYQAPPPQMQDSSSRVPPPQQAALQYQPQQQWPPQVQQPPHQSPMMQPQPQVRAPSAGLYPHYAASQPANPSAPEPSSMQMQMPFSGMRQQIKPTYGMQQPGYGMQPPGDGSQQVKPSYGMQPGYGMQQPGDGYTATGPHPTPSSQGNAYMMYESDGGGRAHHHASQTPPHFPQGSYPPTSVPMNNNNPHQHGSRPPQFWHNHRHSDLIEKLVAMGYRGDQAVVVIQRMEESGEAVDFNTVLDRLNDGAQRRF